MDHPTMGRSRIRPGWLVVAGLGVLPLVAAGVPLVSLLYVGVLLLCPLLMAGMHGGHGRAPGHEGHTEEPDRAGSSDPGASNTRTSRPPVEGGRT